MPDGQREAQQLDLRRGTDPNRFAPNTELRESSRSVRLHDKPRNLVRGHEADTPL
jgi:hypothetical protein